VTQISFTLGSNQAAIDYVAAHPKLVGASISGINVFIPIADGEFTTALGNTLIMDKNGNYTYSYVNNSHIQSESFTYTIQDNNGDSSSSTLSINLIPPDSGANPLS
ncbi:MAG TPA: hypothetical protein PLD88_01860, partial [Candidatus Berkiella sp.]|nr:hypothetical protein [Candidatus Berkiella sp.]